LVLIYGLDRFSVEELTGNTVNAAPPAEFRTVLQEEVEAIGPRVNAAK